MAVTLDTSISRNSLSEDDKVMLDNLQPNIIKPHVRNFLSLLFLQFSSAASARTVLGEIARTTMKSASQHLQEIDNFKATGTPGTPYVGLGIAAGGYAVLGIKPPADVSFQGGMQASTGLNDPPVATWDAYFAEDIHAVVLVGDMLCEQQAKARRDVEAIIDATSGARIVGVQEGVGLHNDNKEGIEHFGYVDGRSQPLFIKEDVEDEENHSDGIANWDPDFPLKQLIVGDPGAENPALHFGSYLIYRKLEQNVKLFKTEELALASRLGLADDERAGAMIVGRFEDGTPITMQFDDGVESPVPNNFNYHSDKQGAKCPFPGHIRKTNPRGSGGFGATNAQERTHLMARRGQTYGVRADNPNDGVLENKPEKDVGLLFMAFNSDIARQFEFTQISWANNSSFPQVPPGAPDPGVDPIIGQTPGDAARPHITCPVKWGDAASSTTVANVPRAVTMKGGEYFFAPSLNFLRAM